MCSSTDNIKELIEKDLAKVLEEGCEALLNVKVKITVDKAEVSGRIKTPKKGLLKRLFAWLGE